MSLPMSYLLLGMLVIVQVALICAADEYIITTIAGIGAIGSSNDNGPATSSLFNYPYSVVVDAIGNVYISDIDNNKIRKVCAWM